MSAIAFIILVVFILNGLVRQDKRKKREAQLIARDKYRRYQRRIARLEQLERDIDKGSS